MADENPYGGDIVTEDGCTVRVAPGEFVADGRANAGMTIVAFIMQVGDIRMASTRLTPKEARELSVLLAARAEAEGA